MSDVIILADIKYNEKGEATYLKSENGTEWWMKYGDSGNITYSMVKNPDPKMPSVERFMDSRGNQIHSRITVLGAVVLESWKDFDVNDNVTYFKVRANGNTYEEWKEYDAQGNLLHYINSHGQTWNNDFDAIEFWNKSYNNGNIVVNCKQN